MILSPLGKLHAQEQTAPNLEEDTIAYKVSIENEGEAPHFLVEMSFSGKNIQGFTLRWMGLDGCSEPSFEFVELQNAQRTDLKEKSADILSAAPSSSGLITVKYKVAPKFTGFAFPIDEVSGCSLLTINKDNAFIDGRVLFLAPRMMAQAIDDTGNRYRFGKAELSFLKVPEDWELVSSLDGFAAGQTIKVGGSYGPWRMREAYFFADCF